MKAIETRYAGCHFRSRLEARWAVFFDALKIKWEYEPQGFSLPSGPYLPDFWLPELETWIEVKGHDPNESDRTKLIELAVEVCELRQRCRLLGPIPQTPIQMPMLDEPCVPALVPIPEYIPLAGPNVDDLVRTVDGTLVVDQRAYAGIPVEYWNLRPMPWCPRKTGSDLQAALDAARSARFEHGQSGATPFQAGSAITDRPRRGGRASRGPYPWRPANETP